MSLYGDKGWTPAGNNQIKQTWKGVQTSGEKSGKHTLIISQLPRWTAAEIGCHCKFSTTFKVIVLLGDNQPFSGNCGKVQLLFAQKSISLPLFCSHVIMLSQSLIYNQENSKFSQLHFLSFFFFYYCYIAQCPNSHVYIKGERENRSIFIICYKHSGFYKDTSRKG